MSKVPCFTKIQCSGSINYDANMKCQRLRIPLYTSSNVPSYKDIVQGYIGSCWFLCSLASYIRPGLDLEIRQADFKEMIDLFQETSDRRLYKVYLNNHVFVVDDWVPEDYIYKTPTCLWYILFEKAMLSMMGLGKLSFDIDPKGRKCCRNIKIDLGEANVAALGLKHILKGSPAYRYLHSEDIVGNHKVITAKEMYILYRNGQHLLANTALETYPTQSNKQTVAVHNFNAVRSHCYCILEIEYVNNKYIFTMYNPWGRKSIKDIDDNLYLTTAKDEGIFKISWERFYQVFACVHHTF